MSTGLIALLAAFGVVVFGVLLAVVSASQQVFLALTEAQARRLKDDEGEAADRIIEFVRTPHQVIITTTLASGVFAAGALLCVLLLLSTARPLTPTSAIVPGLFVGLIFAVLGRALPRAFVSMRPGTAAKRLVGPYAFVELLFRPLSWTARKLLERVSDEARDDLIAAEELKAVAGESDEAPRLEEEKRELLHSIFEFGATTAREVMVPRIDMIMAEAASSCDDALELIARHGHSRIPVYEESVDRILGVVHVKELVRHGTKNGDEASIRDYARPTMFVPETKKIDELLREFQEKKSHLAIVVDEYGGTSGMVTMEDVLEEIVGEIEDEYDTQETLLEPLSDGSFRVAAKIDLDDLNEQINVNLPTDNSDTLGGFIYELVGKVPTPGETVSYRGLNFIIDRVHRQRIVRVRIRKEKREEVRA